MALGNQTAVHKPWSKWRHHHQIQACQGHQSAAVSSTQIHGFRVMLQSPFLGRDGALHAQLSVEQNQLS